MDLNLNRIVISNGLTDAEYRDISFAILSLMSSGKIEKDYHYVYVDKKTGVNVISLAENEVFWQSKRLNCTDKEAVVSIIEYEGFYESLSTLLYDQGIGGYKKFNCITKEIVISNDLDPYVCYETDMRYAKYYFESILRLEEIISIYEDEEEEKI